MNRRNLLKSYAFMIMAGATPAFAAARRSATFWGDDGPGVQLFALEQDLKRDFAGTLGDVFRIGYRCVELASMHGRTAAEMRAALDTAGLHCRSVHVSASAGAPGASGLTFDDPGKLADDLAILGARDAVLPLLQFPKNPVWGDPVSVGALMRTGGPPLPAERYERMADFLNQTGATLKKRGVRIGYHNQNFELAPLGDRTGFQILLERTDPGLVHFEMDAGWLAAAGHDPVTWLNKYTGRFSQMHVKDIKASTVTNFNMRQDPTEVGSGKMDWPRILPAARAAGVQRYFVEQDPPYSGPRIQSLAKSLAYLSTLGVANR